MEGCLALPRHRLPEITYARSVEIRIAAAILVRHGVCRRTSNGSSHRIPDFSVGLPGRNDSVCGASDIRF